MQQQGSALVIVLVLTVLLAGLASALCTTTITHHRSAAESLNTEFAYRAAESGVAYYLAQFATDPTHLEDDPTPRAPVRIGEGTFTLTEAFINPDENYWQITVVGRYHGVQVPVAAAIGYEAIRFPAGIVVAGTGDPEAVVFSLQGGSRVIGYRDGLLDPEAPTEPATLLVNGTADLAGGSHVDGNLVATGFVDLSGNATVSGELTEEVPHVAIEGIDDRVAETIRATLTGNNNVVLSGIFGNQWTPVAGDENYGDLVIVGGEYVIPAGSYRLRRWEITGEATVTFDTTEGPATVVVLGDSALSVTNASNVRVAPGGTENGLITVLSTGTSLEVGSHATFGSAVGHGDSARFVQILSGRDNASASEIRLRSHAKVYGNVVAESHAMTLAGNSMWLGSALVESMEVSGASADPAHVAIDVDAARSLGVDTGSFRILSRWRPETPGEDIEL